MIAIDRLILLLVLLACSYKNASAQKEKSDTIFLLRENKEFYHVVFIENNKNSSFYNAIITNRFNPIDTALYLENMSLLKQNIKIKKHNLLGIPRDWRPIYQYKGKYYLYAPSDWGNDNWVQVNDSTFVEYIFDDSASPSAITSVHKIGRDFHISVWNLRRKSRTIKIHIIDDKRKIAVFEDSSIQGDGRFFLMVPVDNVRLFPIIVNYSPSQKVDEFEFDKLNYQKLIDQKKPR